MKHIDELLSYFQSLDIRLWADGDQLNYSAPKGILTPALKSQMQERKSEIIKFLQKTDFASSFSIRPILPVPRNTDLPLSFAQQRLWFLQQMEPDNPLYNEHGAAQLTGLLDVASLEQSLNEIVRRHEALRTTFKMVDGQPFQIIVPNLKVPLPVLNLCKLPEAEQNIEIQRIADEQNQRPFDLSQGPLLRWKLLQLGEQQYVLMFTIHHIISDGWSAGILIRELSALYQAFSTGKSLPLPELPIQYADFAIWQRQELQGEKLKSQLSYWRQQLGGNLPVLQLPTDWPRPKVQTFQGAMEFLVLSKTLSDALKTISAKEGVTLFMTLLAAFQTLLHWYTDQDDIVVGTDVANRNQAEIEGLIGFFVNQLVLRTYLGGNPSFQGLLTRVKEVTLGAYDHQDMPFDKLVETLNPERDLRRMPLFQVKLILQNTPMPPLELAHLTLNILRAEQKMTGLDLLLMMEDTKQGLVGTLKYSTDLFDAATITRMLEHFEILLDKLVTYPNARLEELLEILTKADNQQKTIKKNNRKEEFSKKLNQAKRKVIHATAETEEAG